MTVLDGIISGVEVSPGRTISTGVGDKVAVRLGGKDEIGLAVDSGGWKNILGSPPSSAIPPMAKNANVRYIVIEMEQLFPGCPFSSLETRLGFGVC
jgi:hypothetical protein